MVSWELSPGPLSGLTLPLQGTCWLGLVRHLFCWPARSHLKMYFLPFFACLHLKNNCQHLKTEHSDLLKKYFFKKKQNQHGQRQAISLGTRLWALYLLRSLSLLPPATQPLPCPCPPASPGARAPWPVGAANRTCCSAPASAAHFLLAAGAVDAAGGAQANVGAPGVCSPPPPGGLCSGRSAPSCARCHGLLWSRNCSQDSAWRRAEAERVLRVSCPLCGAAQALWLPLGLCRERPLPAPGAGVLQVPTCPLLPLPFLVLGGAWASHVVWGQGQRLRRAHCLVLRLLQRLRRQVRHRQGQGGQERRRLRV